MSGKNPQGARNGAFFFLLAAITALGLASCSAPVGWGVVLWPPEIPGIDERPEASDQPPTVAGAEATASPAPSGLASGDLVPVYVKSLIRKIYVVGVPGSKAKVELEQWRVEFSKGKGKAKKYRDAFAECAPLFAIATKDGLEIREKADNKEDTVYRLRASERLKLLRKVEGVAVETGGKRLAGDWYEALSADGTKGYVYSNTLRVYDVRSGSVAAGSPAETDGSEASIDIALSKTWRPEYFKRMLDDGRFDLSEFSLKYGFFVDTMKKELKVELPKHSIRVAYTGVVALKRNLYGFEGTNVRLLLRGDDLLTLEFPLPDGKTRSEVMVTVEADIEAAIRAEEDRRQAILGKVLSRGRILRSDSYGSLEIQRSRRFSWTGYGMLSPLVIPEGSGESGEMAFDGYLDEELAKDLDGVMSFYFDGLPRSTPVRFYYSITADGLRLEQVPPAAFDPTGLVARKRGTGPLVAFFSFAE